MLTRTVRFGRRQSAGFSIIEMMIALALGLVVSGAALALTVSIIKSNNETVVAARLTQELRALLGVIGREASRARFMSDPLGNVGRAALRANANDIVIGPAADCLRFSYFDPDPDRNPATADGANRAVAIARRNGAIFAVANNVALTVVPTTLPTCDEATTRLSSPQIDITSFRAEIVDVIDADADGQLDPGNEAGLLALEIQGALLGDTSGLGITRVVRERMRIGSARLPPAPPPPP